MRWLIDTNILMRLANPSDVAFALASNAIDSLHSSGESLLITPQNLIEFRNAATRAKTGNGLGLSSAAVEAEAARFEAMFPLLEDIPAIFPAWKALVARVGVIGKQVHDARLVAVCHAHGVSHLLTFNGGHFARLAGIGPGLVVVAPGQV